MSVDLRFVLLAPAIPENVGAVARAMKNFAWHDLAIVRPEFTDWEPAHRMAVHSGDLLNAAERPESIADAVRDCVWVVGTSSRRRRGQRSLTPRQFAEQAVERGATGRIALVFGAERSGLTNEELDLCHDVSTVPTDPAQPSINLAQAVLLYSYECRMAVQEQRGRIPPTLPKAATEAEIRQVESSLESMLRSAAFLHTGNTRVMKELTAPLVRSRLSKQEYRVWVAALKSTEKQLRANRSESNDIVSVAGIEGSERADSPETTADLNGNSVE